MNVNNKNSILVTGATGQIGAITLSKIIEKWWDSLENVYILTRNIVRASRVFQILGIESEKVVPIEWDITRIEEIKQKIPKDISTILHLAADVSFGSDGENAKKTNTIWTQNIARIAYANGIRLISWSTAFIPYLSKNGEGLPEDWVESPDEEASNNYEISKAGGEKAIQDIYSSLMHDQQELAKRLHMVRIWIATDGAIERPDIEIPHSTTGYVWAHINLRNSLIEMGESDWIDLEGMQFKWKPECLVNLICNSHLGDFLAESVITGENKKVFTNFVSANPSSYRKIIEWIMDYLKFTWYKIGDETIQKTAGKKISDLGKIGEVLKRRLEMQYRKIFDKYKPYVTKTREFSWGFWATDPENQALVEKATQILMPKNW